MAQTRLVAAQPGIASTNAARSAADEANDREDLVVLIAASLQPVIEDLVSAYDANQKVRISAGSSGSLKRQITAGAPCDLFIPADPAYLHDLITDATPPNHLRTLAANSLVAVTRPGLDIHAPWPNALDTGEIRSLAIANPAHAPAGRRAREALEQLGLWHTLAERLVMADDVRMALRLAETSTVDAAIVYASDAATSTRVREAYRFPARRHGDIRYDALVIGHHPDAPRLLAFLADPAQRPKWQRHGFQVDVSVEETTPAITAPPNTAPPNTAPPNTVPPNTVPPKTLPAAAEASVVGPLLVSLKASTLAMIVMVAPGLALAAWLARTRSRARSAVEALLVIPLVLPPVVTGLALLIAVKSIFPEALFTWWAAALASGVVSIPLLVRTARSGFESIDPRLSAVAATLGAGPLRTFVTVQLPLAMPAITAGLLLAWARAIGEFGATIVVAGNFPGRTQTLPLAIWTELQRPDTTGRLAPLVAVAVGIAVIAVIVGEIATSRAAGDDRP